MHIEVRPMTMDEMSLMVNYFLNASPDFLQKMGVAPDKLPDKKSWLALLEQDLAKPLKERSFFYLIWIVDGEAIGHSNINKITYGQQAAMHLHIWNPSHRKKGIGKACVWKSITQYFDHFDLETLFCEPNAHNQGPNQTLKKLGFDFIEQVEMVPGWINFLQPINRYRLTRTAFHRISKENEPEG